MLAGKGSGGVGNFASYFAAEGASVGDGISGLSAGRTPRGIDFEIRRFNPPGSECYRPITFGKLQRWA
tara:strand:- start:203 stop:406 length:204 start_codon:yes stop_codon:yes gene_type:complete